MNKLTIENFHDVFYTIMNTFNSFDNDQKQKLVTAFNESFDKMGDIGEFGSDRQFDPRNKQPNRQPVRFIWFPNTYIVIDIRGNVLDAFPTTEDYHLYSVHHKYEKTSMNHWMYFGTNIPDYVELLKKFEDPCTDPIKFYNFYLKKYIIEQLSKEGKLL